MRNAYMDQLLRVGEYDEGEPSNGLLIDAGRPVTRIAAAVNTSFRSIAGAAAAGVELQLVHHATWASIDRGLKAEKEARLRTTGVSLYGAHAALDCHPKLSPSVVLARQLGVVTVVPDERSGPGDHGLPLVHGRVEGTFAGFVERTHRELGVRPEAWQNTDAFRRVALVAGGGGLTRYLEAALALGCDTYVTGEGSMYTKLYAREAGLNLVLGTHYATERLGVQAWVAHVAERFSLPRVFVSEDADIL